MNEHDAHPAEELQDLLDDRLAEPRRAAVAAHVESCQRCRRELDALRWVKTSLAERLPAETTPPDLAGRVREALDRSDRSDRPATPRRVSRRAWVGAALAASLALLVWRRGHRSSALPSLVALDYAALAAGDLALDIRSEDPQEVEAHFARGGIDFPTHVYDLGMMRYTLAGGRVHELDGRRSALFAYRGPDGTPLVCQMYEGRVSELPPDGDRRVHRGITFHVYRSADVTVVFWQEAAIVCVLASRDPAETVVQLAFAKAMPASG